MWVGMISLTFVLRSFKGRCYGNHFSRKRIGENCCTPLSFNGLAFHDGLEDRNADGSRDVVMTPLRHTEIWLSLVQ